MRHKILLKFVIQTDYLIVAKRPDLVLINKKKKKKKKKKRKKKKRTCLVNFENQGKQKDKQIIRHCLRTQKTLPHEIDGWYHLWLVRSEQSLKAGRVGNLRKNRDRTDDTIVKIGQNIQKSPDGRRRLVVTQPPVKDHQLTFDLVWFGLVL